MSFDTSITRLPLPFDTDRAEDLAAGLQGLPAGTKDLLKGTAGCSPYLEGLIRKEAGWLEEVFAATPGVALDAVLDDARRAVGTNASRVLRQAKGRVALLTGLADLAGVWDLDRVTESLTRFADISVEVAFKTVLERELRRGKLPGATEDDLTDCAGLFALAMGKMGAFELNYSSDIDLICMFDDARYDYEDLPEARSVFVRVVRKAMGLLSDLTADGYVFRTDLRLRPDPSVTPVAVSTTSAERYYEALGRTWERAAYVKARPAAGAVEAGWRFLDDIRPFIWRRHLDYATVEDAHTLRQKIRAHKGGAQGLDGRNVKLGSGGIREIEFFTQTHQLISGGRDPDLRLRGTRDSLRMLVSKGWVDSGDADTLDGCYVRLREIEHRLQMLRDAQTHDLPNTPDGWQRLAMFCGTDDPKTLRDELGEIFETVHELTESFFAPMRRPSDKATGVSDRAQEWVERWRGYPALRSERAQTIFARLLPDLMARFDAAAHPDQAMSRFDGFLRGLPAGVQLFALFEANPQLVDLIVDICSTAPALAQYLSRNSGVLDAVIGGDFFAPWPAADDLSRELTEQLASTPDDYEAQLDTARRWMKDWHFRIGVHFLRGLITAAEASGQYSDLAAATVAALWPVVQDEFARKFGRVPGRGGIVLGMGSLGARQLSAGSDLDLILIYDADSDAVSDGRKSLSARQYYARLTKALVTALSARTAEGALYEVDMRLRPSGRQGPAATSWASYQNYQRTEAWTWEHLALTRARVIAGDHALAQKVESFRKEMVKSKRDPGKMWTDLVDMRRRLSDAKPKSGIWDVSNGSGGLQDIELFAQALALESGSGKRQSRDQLELAREKLGGEAADMLLSAHRLLSSVKSVASLLTGGGIAPADLGHGGIEMLLRVTEANDMKALEDRIDQECESAAKVIGDAVLPYGDAGPADQR
ncbi:glutamine-synthetase adenylyltransferase [Qingshengfaniella alkalisoli]|uniref:Glutamine-synthetase adenylyltransferase n=1 Tax=Qingshengfaniella alkalisoli TaxID=2599296 RepID=A0A5B8IXM6_9RHOB|nr:glutamine-synthetase adenylyltransferase [Qingshengfaniella alkalisoli]QDY69368.1 glutamine-synthetase adenylyltransferase [Qingshengfaniella alkalisoli]